MPVCQTCCRTDPPHGFYRPCRWRAAVSFFLLILAALILSACQRQSQPSPQDAYIWQRQWTPAVIRAMHDSSSFVAQWRVLAAELDAGGRWNMAAPDWRALQAATRPVVLVVRINGQLKDFSQTDVLQQISRLRAQWQAAGVTLAGIEIDHDCATARLPAYAEFLHALRPQMASQEILSITALPTWLTSPALDALLAAADEAVLQVHAVMNPRQGLFDAKRASGWVQDFAQRTRHPWRVALPTYSTRVTWNARGMVTAIESEQATLATSDTAQELMAQPQVMADFVAQLERDAPAGLAGVVWFRLPTGDDMRAWSSATWLAVLQRQALRPVLQVQARTGAEAGMHDVILRNTGNADAVLPATVRLDQACQLADGINGYVLASDARGKYLKRAQNGLLHAGRQRNIGWIRCLDHSRLPLPSPFLHVEP